MSQTIIQVDGALGARFKAEAAASAIAAATAQGLAEGARDVAIAAGTQYASEAAAVAGLADGTFGSYLDEDGNPIWGQRTGATMTPLPGPWISGDKIGFTQSGSGAVSRTVRAKILETRVSVQDFGAVGDGSSNDAAAFQAASAAAGAYGTVRIPYSYNPYMVNGQVSILEGQTWVSEGARLKHTDDTLSILRADSVGDWSILGRLILEGTLTTAATAAEIGLHITNGKRYVVEGLQARNFKGAGIKLDGSGGTGNGLRGDRGQFSNCSAHQSTIGIHIDQGSGSEYNAFTNFLASGCTTGALIDGGNNGFASGGFTDNTVGVKLVGVGGNHGHGQFVGCNINHNSDSNLEAVGVLNGYTFVGCHFYGNSAGSSSGNIWLNGCEGVSIRSGIIDCWVFNDLGSGSGANYITDNFQPTGGTGITLNTNNGGLKQLYFMRNYTADGPHPLNDSAAVYVMVTRATTAQDVTTGATTLIFNSEVRDTREIHNTSTGRTTVPVAGIYRISISGVIIADSTTALQNGFIAITKNGTTDGFVSVVAVSTTVGVISGGYVDVVCAAGDILDARITITGTNPTLATGARLTIQLLD